MVSRRYSAARIGAFVGALAVIACIVVGPEYLPGRPSKFNFNRLHNGMTPQRVEQIMGKPTGIGWDYPYHPDKVISFGWDGEKERYDAVFRDGALVDKGHFRYHTP